MKRFQLSPISASIFCSSLEVPSVVVTMACVSPRWNSAEPWTRGRRPTSQRDGADRAARRGRRCACFSSSTISRTTSSLRSSNSSLMSFSFGLTLLVAELGGERLGEHVLLQLLVALVARLLLLDDAGLTQVLVRRAPRRAGRSPRPASRRELALRLAHRGAELLDELEDLLALACANMSASMMSALARLVGAAFDHDDRVLGDGDDEVDVGLLDLLEGRVARRTRRSTRATRMPASGPAHGMSEMCSAALAPVSARTSVGFILSLRQHRRDDLRVLLEALGKQRAAAGDP